MKRILIGVFVLWALFLAVGLLLPQDYEIRRSAVIQAEPEVIHQYTSDLQQWQHWQTWLEIDPSVKIEFGPIHKGTGASQSWTSDSGNGKLNITLSSPEKGLYYDISFNDGNNLAQAELTYQDAGEEGTEVIWHMKGNLNTPIFGGYLAFFMDQLVGDSFELGLVKLKNLAEKTTNQ